MFAKPSFRPRLWRSVNDTCRLFQRPHTHHCLRCHSSALPLASASLASESSEGDCAQWLRLLAIAGVTCAFSTGLSLSRQSNSVKACGIIGVVSDNEEAVGYLMEGLHILQNRGYDSCGVATMQYNDTSSPPTVSGSVNNAQLHRVPAKQLNRKKSQSKSTSLESEEEARKRNLRDVFITKYASRGATDDSIRLLQQDLARHAGHTIGIGHTRWATHGAKTDTNAHPHCDWKERVALIHNGTIENCGELRTLLQSRGIDFQSETDTEVIANLVGWYLESGSKDGSKMSIEEALKLALNDCEGSWGLAMVSPMTPDRMYVARNGSPMVIGLAGDKTFVASEHTAFQKYTNQFIALKDGEMAVITRNGVDSLDKSRIELISEEASHERVKLSPAPYPHWTIHEIFEQPEAVSRSLGYGSRIRSDSDVKLGGLESQLPTMSKIRNLVISGCGTSKFAGMYGARLMEWLKSFETIQVIDAGEITMDSFPNTEDKETSGLLVVSQSGETKDVLNALKIADSLGGIASFSVVNAVGSAIARTTGCGVYVYAGREHGVASTKAFMTQVTCLGLIAAWFARLGKSNEHITHGSSQTLHRVRQLIEAFHRLPTYIGMLLQCRLQMKELAQELQSSQHMFVLGKGFAEPIAYEGALKIKEITYVHCEGYSGSALKHGPFALIEDGTPVVMIVIDDEHWRHMVTNAHEIESRGGRIIYLTNNPERLKREGLGWKHKSERTGKIVNDVVKVPTNGPLTALLSVIPLQILAYEMSVLKGINPDKPKNLAKAVTVD